MPSETFKVQARKGVVSMIESSLGYFEVWATDGSLGEPQRFSTWELAVEAYEYALVGERVNTTLAKVSTPLRLRRRL